MHAKFSALAETGKWVKFSLEDFATDYKQVKVKTNL